MTDEEIYTQLQTGDLDRSGFAAMVPRFTRIIRNYFAGPRYRFAPIDIEDLIHTALMAAHRSLVRPGILIHGSLLRFYVKGVASNVAKAHIERLMQLRRADNILCPKMVDHCTPDPLDVVLDKEATSALQRVLRTLPLHYGDILDRFYLAEQPAEQIEEELHLTPTQFRLRKSRALKSALSVRRNLDARDRTSATARQIQSDIGGY